MPQITVDYSAQLADDFDRPAFARALHTAVVEIAAEPPACKTQFRRGEDTMVGPDTEGHAVVTSPRAARGPHRRDQGPAHRGRSWNCCGST